MWILALLLLSSISVVESGARVLVSKSWNSQNFIAGKEFSVLYTIVNVGTEATPEVRLNDQETFPSENFDVRGLLTPVFYNVQPGKSITHSILVTPKSYGQFDDKEAKVVIVDGKTKAESRAQSDKDMRKLYIYDGSASVHYERKLAPWLIFFACTSVPTLLAMTLYERSANHYKRYQKNRPATQGGRLPSGL